MASGGIEGNTATPNEGREGEEDRDLAEEWMEDDETVEVPLVMLRALASLISGEEVSSGEEDGEGSGSFRMARLRSTMVLVSSHLAGVGGAKAHGEMVDALRGMTRSEAIMEAFAAVDRRDFIEPFETTGCYEDAPVWCPPLHQSAPSMYSCALDALDLRPGTSFLNIGSGSGYLSALVVELTGRQSFHIGLELNAAMASHATAKFAQRYGSEKTPATFLGGDCFAVDVDTSPKFDRVYVGAGAGRSARRLLRLLKKHGVLVAPLADDDGNQALVKAVRVSPTAWRLEKRQVRVEFAPLVDDPDRPSHTFRLPGPIWHQAHSSQFPVSFVKIVTFLNRLVNEAKFSRQIPWDDVWNKQIIAYLPADAFESIVVHHDTSLQGSVTCSHCLQRPGPLARCLCLAVAYCSKACQESHFPDHLKECPGSPVLHQQEEPSRRRRRRTSRHVSWLWEEDI